MCYSLKERPMSPCPPTTHSGLSMTSPLSTNVNLGSPVAPCAPFRTNNPVCNKITFCLCLINSIELIFNQSIVSKKVKYALVLIVLLINDVILFN